MKNRNYDLATLGYIGALFHVAIVLVTVMLLCDAADRDLIDWVPLVLWLLFLLGMAAKYFVDTRGAKDGGA